MTAADEPQAWAGQELLDRWVRQGLITPDQAARIDAAERSAEHRPPAPPTVPGHPFAAPVRSSEQRRGGLVAEALGYLGGVLVLAAILLLTGLLWADLSVATRLAIPAAATALLLASGWLVGTEAGAGRRVRSSVWLLGAATWCGVLAVLSRDVLDLTPRDTALLIGAGAVALTVPLYVWFRSGAQQLGAFAALLLLAGALGARSDWDEPTLIGLCGWVVAVTWFALAELRYVVPAAVGRYAAAIGAVVMAQVTAGTGAGHLLVWVTLALLFTYAVRTDELGLLAIAAVGTLQAVPSTVSYLFGERVRLAAPMALLVAGGVLVGVAVIMVRRRGEGLGAAQPGQRRIPRVQSPRRP